jgi:hypothetical protein
MQTPESPRDTRRNLKKKQDVLEVSHAKIVAELEARLDELDSWEPGPALDAELSKVRKELQMWQKQWKRLSDCQSEWIGYKATCCNTALAVPIGCNHRLCFLCNSHRLRKYRERIRTLFDRLTNPVFLTLTVPNTAKLSKRTFSSLRRAWNQFRKSQSWIEGGVYALETTYRKPHQPQAPWHTHAHALIGAATPLPQCSCGKCDRCGRWCKRAVCGCGGHTSWRWHRYDDTGKWAKEHAADCKFVLFKRRIEFDWFVFTGGRKAGWSALGFHQWFRKTECCYWRSESDRNQWNSRNRRTVDVRRVTDREKACLEVLKYVTKAGDFAHDHQAVKEFSLASRGARMLQTFGSWYGLKLDPDVNKGAPSAENDWHGLKCDCGKNQFERYGKVYYEAVRMDKTGRWLLRDSIFKDRRAESPPLEAVQCHQGQEAQQTGTQAAGSPTNPTLF